MPFVPDEEEEEERQQFGPTPGFVPDPEPAKPARGFIPDEPAKPTPGFVADSPKDSRVINALATAARVVFPTAGTVLTAGTPLGGAIGGAAGETTGQLIEMVGGQRKKLSPGVIATEAAIGAVPFGKLAKVAGATGRFAKTAAGAAEATGIGLSSLTSRKLIEEGELPSGSEALATGLGSAALGGLIGRAGTKPARQPLTKAAGATGKSVAIGGQTPADVLGDDIAARMAAKVAPEDAAGQVLTGSYRMTKELVRLVKNNPDELQKLGQTEAFQEGLRLNRQFAELVKRENLGDSVVQEFIRRNRLALEQEFSLAGLQLNQMSQLRKAFAEAMGNGLGDLAAKPSIYRELENARRILMVSQLTTAVRNFWSQGARYTTGVVDEAFRAALQGERPLEARNLLQNVPGFRGARKRTEAVLKEFMTESAKFRRPQEETIGGTRGAFREGVQKFATAMNLGLNEAQEMLYRSTTFDAFLRADLERRGIDAAAAVQAPGNLIPRESVQYATQKALEFTFQAQPTGKAAQDILENWNSKPLLYAIQPYPRFFANSLKFIANHNPAGILRLLGGNGRLLSLANARDPAAAAQIIAEASAGTMAMAAALTLRSTPQAGERWYEVKVGENDRADIRSYAPFSSFVFMAEVAKQLGETGELRMTKQDIIDGLFGMQRLAGISRLGRDFLGEGWERLSAGELEGIGDRAITGVVEAVGQWMGGFSVPFRQFKDVASAFSGEEGRVRDVSARPLVGPTLANLPFANRALPAKASPTTGKKYGARLPFYKFFTGASVQERDPVEAEANRLGLTYPELFPRAPERERRNRATTLQGLVAYPLLQRMLASERYRGMSDDAKRDTFVSALAPAKKRAELVVQREFREEEPEKAKSADLTRRLSNTPRGNALLRERLRRRLEEAAAETR